MAEKNINFGSGIKKLKEEKIYIVDKIELRASIISLRSDGIMHIHIILVDKFEQDDLKDMVQWYYDIGKGKKFVSMITFEDFFVIDSETRKYAATADGAKYSKAEAFVVKSVALKLLGNFYIIFNKPSRPTHIFDSEEKAIEWLKTFL